MADEKRVMGRPWWEPYALTCEPIKVQGMTINPGELVVVLWDGKRYLEPYKGWAAIPAEDLEFGIGAPQGSIGYWLDTLPSTAPPGIARPGPGPHSIKSFEHPNLLEGLIKEIDADN
jgi:hypothetical protein